VVRLERLDERTRHVSVAAGRLAGAIYGRASGGPHPEDSKAALACRAGRRAVVKPLSSETAVYKIMNLGAG